MSMSALSWHDDRSPRELARWAIAGAIVLGVHAGALIYLLAVHEPDVVGSNMDVVTVELAPIDSTPDAVEQDLAPAPETWSNRARCLNYRSRRKSRRSK